MSGIVVDLFAGAGGWSEGLRSAGFDGLEVGLEWDHAACRTAVAAGHQRIRCDVAAYPTAPFGAQVDGLIASPPCQSFSAAGRGLGFDDPRGLLSHEPLRWARDLRPRWIALEQVPEVLPHWRHVAHELRLLGYSTWTGVLCAADYGVPQTRRRAILIARCDGVLATAPEATHSELGADDLFGGMPRWVSMASALGWDGAGLKRDRGRGMAERHGDRLPRSMDEPAFTITCGEGGTGTRMSWVLRNNNTAHAAVRRLDEPAPTMFFGGRCNAVDWVLRTGNNTMKHSRTGSRAGQGGVLAYERSCSEPAPTLDTNIGSKWSATNGEETRRVTVEEAGVLQSFRADYPWQGAKSERYKQVGNAVPPGLAQAIVAPLLGVLSKAVAA